MRSRRVALYSDPISEMDRLHVKSMPVDPDQVPSSLLYRHDVDHVGFDMFLRTVVWISAFPVEKISRWSETLSPRRFIMQLRGLKCSRKSPRRKVAHTKIPRRNVAPTANSHGESHNGGVWSILWSTLCFGGTQRFDTCWIILQSGIINSATLSITNNAAVQPSHRASR